MSKTQATIVCDCIGTCNGAGNCFKCPHLTQTKIVTSDHLFKEEDQ